MSAPPPRLSTPRDLLVMALLALGAVLLRVPSWWNSDIDWDEGMFALAGREIARGHLPYTVLFDIKPLGLWVLVGAAQLLLGESLIAVRALGAACVGVTAGLLYMLGLSAAGARAPALAGAVLYIAFSTQLTGLASHTEILMAPWMTAAALLVLRTLQRPPAGRPDGALALAGLCVGVAVAVKPVAVVPGCLFFVLVAWHWWRGGHASLGLLLRAALVYAAAAGAPFFLGALVYLAAGRIELFWHVYFGFKAAYVQREMDHDTLVGNAIRIVLTLWPLALLALALPARLLAERGGWPVAFALAWLAAEAIAAAAAWQFYPHYFLLLLPPLCLGAALTLQHLARAFVLPAQTRRATLGAAGLLALIPLMPYLVERPWLSLGRPDPLARLGEAIAAATPPGGQVFLPMMAPMTYFLARAEPATPFLFPTHLLGIDHGVLPPGVTAEAELARMLAARPAVIVIQREALSLAVPARRALLEASLADYRLAGEVTVRGRRFEILRAP